MTVNVIDAICGKGKTVGMINYINNPSNESKKILYITPFLTEVERIQKSCPSRNFKVPEAKGSKTHNIKYLLSKGENIVSSHALFKRFDQETIDITSLDDYTLIMDEVADVVQVSNISKFDLDTILEKYVTVDSNGMLTWVATEYEGEFEKYKRQCELKTLYIYPSKDAPKKFLIWMFPVNIFKAFKEVYILTYLFDAQIQKYYYDYFQVPYNKMYLKDLQIVESYQELDLSMYKNLINICDNEKMNRIGESDGSLSSTWYQRNNKVLFGILKANCENYFKNIVKGKSKDNMWTTFKDSKNLIKGKGYTKGFVSLSTRATNLYIDKYNIAYLANRYLNPVIKNFFYFHGIKVDEDGFALSELIQFIFRSRIRNEEPISIYIPSLRMRKLLENWIKNIY